MTKGWARSSDRYPIQGLTVAHERASSASAGMRFTWSIVGQVLNRPYRVTIPMVLLVSMVPFYLWIAVQARGGSVHAPAMVLDDVLPLVPAAALVYGALYAFLIVLPVLIVQQDELIRRTVWAYLTVWSVAYVCFLVYPTVAPRPATVTGTGFAVWGLQFLYDADPPFNCFPSLHVAHSFVSALACHRVNRQLGFIAIMCASVVALSTLLTKQHYVADVGSGVLLAYAAHRLFHRGHARMSVPEFDRRIAPLVALVLGAFISLAVLGVWVAYRLWT